MDSTVNWLTFVSQAGGDSVCTVMHILYGLRKFQGLACLGLEMKLMFVLKIYKIVEDVHWTGLKHYVLCVGLEHLFFFGNYVIKKGLFITPLWSACVLINHFVKVMCVVQLHIQ